MSQLLIQQYLNELQDLRRVSGTSRESVMSEAFKDLLKGLGRAHDLIFVPQYEIETPAKNRRYVDGALLHELRVPFGYWEAKDEKDDLDEEIDVKFRRGYPQDNIIFEDSRQAVLIQNRQQVIRCGVDDPTQLERLLELFFGYERTEIAEFRKAVAQFKSDLPAVLGALRGMIEGQLRDNAALAAAARAFLKHAQETINPNVTDADVREMLIQHILTEEIFAKVFDENDFHRHNNVAQKLYALEGEFFTGGLKKRTLKALEPYYAAIRAAAAQISSHHEKQTFLKIIYENFYKVYNPKAADRLGVIYTPNEIVRFMVESTDWLCERHFGKRLIDRDVEILDPAAGTGTFITELIEHFRGQPTKLRYKYLGELHANEVAILSYYVANLNIEATYAAITEEYAEFPNLCFVDTLDNVSALRAARGSQGDLFGGISEENVARIKRQNASKISVIIGNPPYNANQLNENENNKNREYATIDRRIKATYIKASTAQKTKLYDMYARFFRWATDRLNEDGILSFISNSSFIDSRTYDGFRKVIANEFNEIWIVDLKGNARTSGERRRREGGNVFDNQIRVGIAVYFCVRKRGAHGCRIRYEAVRDYAKGDEKLAFLGATRIADRRFTELTPDTDGNLINQVNNDFRTLVPIAEKNTKSTKVSSQEKAVFKLFSFGVVTNRDEWVYDDSEDNLAKKVRFLVDIYNEEHKRLAHIRDASKMSDMLDKSIKWTRAVKRDLMKAIEYDFDTARITHALYRPYVRRSLYFDSHLNEMQNRTRAFFGQNAQLRNRSIVFSDPTSEKPFMALATDCCPDMHLVGAASGSVILARTRVIDGTVVDNVTNWAFDAFRAQYEAGASKSKRPVTKDAIFCYVYGVLHDPIYREKYALNLKREFPHIPFYADFWRWADWGETLMGLHIGYEAVEPWSLTRLDTPDKRSRRAGLTPKVMLKADKDLGIIQLDSETQLSGVPREAWNYHLANRSALEWILDQHKEKTLKDPTIREKFNNYRFADYKEKVVDLLKRVTRVSVETVAIVEAMRQLPRAWTGEGC